MEQQEIRLRIIEAILASKINFDELKMGATAADVNKIAEEIYSFVYKI